MNENHRTLPKARKSLLITREVAGELLVYDRKTDRAHCLNPTAALIWAHCDGKTTIAKMARLLQDEMKVPVGDEVICFALEQLGKSDLLDTPCLWAMQTEPMSRRGVIMRLGVAAAVTVPFISSITAPTAAQAATCGVTGTPCTANAQCCSNNCINNGRGAFECT
ncbi:MAG: PqqD family protein [Acidobacteriota bacterium]